MATTPIAERDYVEAAAYFYWSEDGYVGYDTASPFGQEHPAGGSESETVTRLRSLKPWGEQLDDGAA